MTSKEFFDSMPEEMKSCAKKIYMYYGKEYPADLHFVSFDLPLSDMMEDTYKMTKDIWFKFWWGEWEEPYKIAEKHRNGEIYTFTNEFIEWAANE